MTWQVGQALTELVKPELTREQLKDYAAAALDHNPIHLEEAAAKRAGFPTVIVHGMLSMAFLGDHLRQNFPESQYRLVRFKVRFRKVTFPGDVLTCRGEIKRSLPNGAWLVSVRTENQNGEITTEGDAEVLPL